MNKKIAFSGIQPSGVVHIGNYLGAIKNWVEIQKEYNSLFCVVDLHAITVPQDPKVLRENTINMIAIMLSAGIDPKKSTVFIQSRVPAHTELTWILNTIAHMGELNRMTQYKEKSEKFKLQQLGKLADNEKTIEKLIDLMEKNPDIEKKIIVKKYIEGYKMGLDEVTKVGLFDYPVLMASDILLYNTDIVPVGEDQKQHVELARDLANRFNNNFGSTFKIPSPIIRKEGARIMGLDNPEKKMSKSAESEYNYIALTDTPEIIKKKISRAVTDSKFTIEFDPKRPGLYNLITIYQLFSEVAPPQIEKKYQGKGYAEFKKDLAEIIIDKLAPFQTKYNKLISDKKYLLDVAKSGAKIANSIAEKKLKEVKEKIGLI